MPFTVLNLKLAAIDVDIMSNADVECMFYKMKVDSEEDITEAIKILQTYRPVVYEKILTATKCCTGAK